MLCVDRDSSVGIAISYGLDGRIQVKARFSALVQTGPGALPASYTSVSQPLWDRGPVYSFFIRRGPGLNKFTHKYLSNFLSSYIKLTLSINN